MNIEKVLGEIGLNRFEITIYLQVLKQGEQAASAIAKAVGMPRSTCRGLLDKLCERQVLAKILKRNTQYYYAHNPTMWQDFLKRQEDHLAHSKAQLGKAMPMLQDLFANNNITPQVQVFQGPNQVIEAFNRSVIEPKIDELLIFTSYDFLKHPLIRKNDDDFFIKKRIKEGIYARVLVGKTDESAKMITKAPHELRERRFIPAKFKLPGNIHLYGNSVMYFSASQDEYLALLVESAMMADTMKTLFEYMWETCG